MRFIEMPKSSIFIVATLFGSLSFNPVLLAADEKGKGKAKGKGGRSAPVVIAIAKQQLLAPMTWVSGTVISRNDARLATEVDGTLNSVAEVGKQVKENDVVAEIDSTFVKLRIDELKAAVEREKAQLQFHRKEGARLTRLAKDNNAAQTRLEQTFADRDIAKNNLNIAETRLQTAKEELWRHSIRAPFPGVISERMKTPGERAKTGDHIIRLVDSQNIEIQSRAPLSSVSFVKLGSKVSFKIDAHESATQHSKIRALVPVGDQRSRMMDVRLEITNKNYRVGQSVRVALPTAQPKEVISVLRDALVLRRDGASIFRVKEDDTAEKVLVKVGIASGDYVEILGQIKVNDRIVVRGGERLRPGQKVKVIKTVDSQK